MNRSVIANFLVAVFVAATVAVVAWAVSRATQPPPQIIEHSDAIECPAGTTARTWYGFDASYTLATCYQGESAYQPNNVRDQLTCKYPEIAVATATGAECQEAS